MVDNAIDPHISIGDGTTLKNPDYCTRPITLDHIRKTINTPLKIISGEGVNTNNFENYSSQIPNTIFENARILQLSSSWNALSKYLTVFSAKTRNNNLRDFFKIDKQLWGDSLTTISLSFPRDPFIPHKYSKTMFTGLDEDSYTVLLDFIYSNSSAFVLVPDIKISTNLLVDSYLNYIDFSVEQLSKWNNKPIFVPLQIDLSQKDSINILTHYKKKNYSNIWINFSNHPCDSDFSANLRSIRQFIEKYMVGLDVILYYSHIKQEIKPHLHDTKVPASDILTQFMGADFIGVKRFGLGYNSKLDDNDYLEKQALKNKYDSIEDYKKAKALHSSRIFNSDTYYYHNLDCYPKHIDLDATILTDKVYNNLMNGMLLYKEVENVKKFIEEESVKTLSNKNPLKSYLKDKTMLVERKSIREFIMPETVQQTLSDLAGL